MSKPRDHLYLTAEERWETFIPIAEMAVGMLDKSFTMTPEQKESARSRVYTALCQVFEQDLTQNLTVTERWCRVYKRI